MTRALKTTPSVLPILPAAAQAALMDAVRRQAMLRLQSCEKPIRGAVHMRLVASDQRGLHGVVRLSDESDREALKAPKLAAVVNLDDCTYSFTTHCEDIQFDGLEATVILAPPLAVHTVQRRRTRRYRLQRPSTVLIFTGEAGRAGPYEAVVLNLSLGGLACRTSSFVGSLLVPGCVIRIELSPAEPAQALTLSARVVGLVPGGSDNTTIINLEFIEADAAQSAVLRSMLDELSDAS
jgi:c-di-GMP-binding flagellar brake protein YcgR